jgi:Zn-finger nucleic acid-binding protein
MEKTNFLNIDSPPKKKNVWVGYWANEHVLQKITFPEPPPFQKADSQIARIKSSPAVWLSAYAPIADP